jgi:hypothetical protein
MTWGTLRPGVLLPEAAGGWPAARLHAVVLHELVHVQRHDLVAQVAAQAACCLYWFHPMVWPAVRQLRKERETACDDAVLSGGVGPLPITPGTCSSWLAAWCSGAVWRMLLQWPRTATWNSAFARCSIAGGIVRP